MSIELLQVQLAQVVEQVQPETLDLLAEREQPEQMDKMAALEPQVQTVDRDLQAQLVQLDQEAGQEQPVIVV